MYGIKIVLPTRSGEKYMEAVCVALHGTCPITGTVRGVLQDIPACEMKGRGALIKRGKKVTIEENGTYNVVGSDGVTRPMKLLRIDGLWYNRSAFKVDEKQKVAQL